MPRMLGKRYESYHIFAVKGKCVIIIYVGSAICCNHSWDNKIVSNSNTDASSKAKQMCS